MDSPLISVIIPCYKQAHFIRDAIGSVQAQSLEEWEVIVVDDGSPDNTAAITQAICATDDRVRLLRKPHGGLSSARNAGLRAARGRFIQFLDADDTIAAHKFRNDLFQVAGIDDACLVLCDYAMLTANGELTAIEHSQPRFLSADPELELAVRWENNLSIPIHCGLIDARLFAGNDQSFNEQLPNHEDFLMWLTLLARKPVIRFSYSCDAFYRRNPEGMSRNHRAMYEGFRAAIEQRLSAGPVRPELRHALQAKRSIVDNSYGYGTRARIRKSLEHAQQIRVLPYRVYCLLLRLWGIGIREQQAALSRSHGLK